MFNFNYEIDTYDSNHTHWYPIYKGQGYISKQSVSTSNFAIQLINRPHKTKVYIASLAIVQRNYYDAFVSVSKQSSSMLLDLQCEEANLSLPGGINTQKC